MESSLTRRCEVCGYRYDSAADFCPQDRRVLPPPDEAAADLGAYRLVEWLADGGMGTVYRAVHKRLGRPVAIKLLHKQLSCDRGIINRFFHEARAANTIRHQHVIEVYDFVESREDVYFVMELLRGQDLHDAIHRPGQADAAPMDLERAASILEQIASALHATHARNIVHRDLKPENVFLSERDGVRDFVKIFDFGVAKLDRPDGRSTVQGAVLGTPEYMSPEQARAAAVDGRSDLYSLGCIAYEMFTRRQIFGGGTHPEILVRQLTEMPPSMLTFVPTLPPALDGAILRALAKDPAKRPQTAMAFAESVAVALGRTADPTAFRTVTRRPTPPRTPPGQILLLREQRASRWKPFLAGVALAGLAVAIALGVGMRHRRAAVTALPAPAAPHVVAAPPPIVPTPEPEPVAVTVLLQSIPPGAQILDEDGNSIGVTPHDLVLPAGGERQVRLQKPGFKSVERRLQARIDTTVAVRLDPERRTGRLRGARVWNKRGHGRAGRLDSGSRTIDPFSR